MLNWIKHYRDSNELDSGSATPTVDPGHKWAKYLKTADGTTWIWDGSVWTKVAAATFGGTIATVDQGTGGASPWLTEPAGWSFANITLAAPTTTVVKSGAGVFHTLTINKPTVSAVITMYDNTAASGTKIGTITLPATLLTEGPHTAVYDVAFGTGLTIVTATGVCDITVSYR